MELAQLINYNEGRELFRSRAMTIFRPTFSLSLLYTHTRYVSPQCPSYYPPKPLASPLTLTSIKYRSTANPSYSRRLHLNNFTMVFPTVLICSVAQRFPKNNHRLTASPRVYQAASNSQGIQTLLEAEKEAAKIVQKAKQFRTERLKAARTEAAKEIDTLKAQKNAEYQAFDTEHSGEADQLVAKVSQETEAKLIEVQTAFAQNKEIVIAKLLETMTNVQPAVHVNAKARS
ncbi:H+-ATPase G subunit-domain-containing protein [Jimgerdemannia flammicorona]|uniref:H+-ATPase G subunit-domain-containing protein n=1 Tax=Jimgerdemannia flammicorona TaxID=994334 RepID=A0A433DHJ9_9FUNG|nr:H+-ATPase G subunit-domain-containing protein [Jimgerdemannia flammicorona]